MRSLILQVRVQELRDLSSLEEEGASIPTSQSLSSHNISCSLSVDSSQSLRLN